MISAFQPQGNTILTIASSAATTGTVASTAVSGYQITSLSTNTVTYVAFGDSTVTVTAPTTAAAGGFPVLPGTTRTFNIGPNKYFSVIGSSAGTSNAIFITPGFGGSQ